MRREPGGGCEIRGVKEIPPSPSLPLKGGGRRLGTTRPKLHGLKLTSGLNQYSSFHLPFAISTMWNAEVSSPM